MNNLRIAIGLMSCVIGHQISQHVYLLSAANRAYGPRLDTEDGQ